MPLFIHPVNFIRDFCAGTIRLEVEEKQKWDTPVTRYEEIPNCYVIWDFSLFSHIAGIRIEELCSVA